MCILVCVCEQVGKCDTEDTKDTHSKRGARKGLGFAVFVLCMWLWRYLVDLVVKMEVVEVQVTGC